MNKKKVLQTLREMWLFKIHICILKFSVNTFISFFFFYIVYGNSVFHQTFSSVVPLCVFAYFHSSLECQKVVCYMFGNLCCIFSFCGLSWLCWRGERNIRRHLEFTTLRTKIGFSCSQPIYTFTYIFCVWKYFFLIIRPIKLAWETET